LRPDQIRLLVDVVAGAGRENGFTLELPSALQGKVKIVSVTPPRFLSASK
jgi:hypothetical protein